MALTNRAWSYIVYPESAPDDWIVGLRQTGLAAGISPLHDSDVYPSEHKLAGQTKKAHWHVVIVWKNKTTWKHASELGEVLLGTKVAKLCGDVVKAVNYWDHDEESNKFKYSMEDAQFYNGLVPEELADLRIEGEREYVFTIKNVIRSNNFTNLWQVDEYLSSLDDMETWDFFRSHTIYFRELMFGYRKSQFADYWEKEKFEKMKKEVGSK